MAIPNCLHIVEQLAQQYPQEWRKAHNPSGGGPETEAFIRRLAWVLHSTVDARFGLNGKRGNYNDISDDVVNWIGEGVGHDPKTGSPVTVIDVIVGAGGANPQPSWQLFNNPAEPSHRGPGGWVKPEPVGGTSSGGGGTPLPAPPSTPPAPDLTPVLMRLDSMWKVLEGIFSRLDEIEKDSANAAHESYQAASRASDIKTQIAALPASRPFPRYKGRVPRAFGGSTDVTLTPEE